MKKFWFISFIVSALLFLSACGNLDIDAGVPDVTTTGQLIVAYDIDTQVIVLEPVVDGECTGWPTYDGEGEILQGVEGVGARAYYGLEPGEYCLTWGPRLSTGWAAYSDMLLTVQAGALDFVSVIPPQAPAETVSLEGAVFTPMAP